VTEIEDEDRLSRVEWLELLARASRDPALPAGRRLWASWMAGEMVAATTVKAADLWKGATGA
jgi:hypothetical protein